MQDEDCIQHTKTNRGEDFLQHRTTQVEEGLHHSHLHRNVNCVYRGELHSMCEDCFQQMQYTGWEMFLV